MSEPKDRTHDTLEEFDAAHLPPGPDGIPRAGSSSFPTEVDKWPEHQDIEDEKVFTKYSHDMYCAMIAVQRFLKQTVLGGGLLHQHFVFQTTYSGNPVIEITDLVDPEFFLAGSVWVTRRGKMLERETEYTLRTDMRSIRLAGAHPDALSEGDTIIIGYAKPLTV